MFVADDEKYRPRAVSPVLPNSQPESSQQNNVESPDVEGYLPSPAASPKPSIRSSTPPDDGGFSMTSDTRAGAPLADGQYSLTHFKRKIRGVEAHVVWYLSQGIKPLLQPNGSIECSPGDLFVHRSAEDGATRIWVRNVEETWAIIHHGGSHPVMPLYRLRMLATGEPRWITRKTETTYRGREKRQPSTVSALLPSFLPSVRSIYAQSH